MTTPKIATIKRGGSRFYVDPETAEKVPGVTSIIGMLPKEFLKWWAAKTVAQTAVDDLGSLVGIAMRDPRAAVDYLKGAPDRDVRQAADNGTAAHDYFEKMAQGQTIGRVHPDLRPYVDHFQEFLDTVQPTILRQEQTVWSDTHAYAGSFDAFGIIDGSPLWLDWKTTRSGVHEEVGLQLAAYRYADKIVLPDGSIDEMPEAEGGAVLHVRPEGWSLTPVRCDREMFDVFLHLREVFRYEKEMKSTVIGRPYASGPDGTTASTQRKRATPAKGASK